jgi:hypothetical protein
MEDTVFVSKLNSIARDESLKLPFLSTGESPSTEFLDDWARFLELCVKEGVQLSDARWKRVTVTSNAPHTRFALDLGEDDPEDPDFRVGLQLLMGMLGPEEDDEG